MSLDHIEAWLGQRNPMKLGEEGAKEDASAGVTLLQEIIKNNDESSHNDDEIEDVRTGWIDRVGEGRTEDENLSLYYRFVEGVQEDSKWIRTGFSDLSSYHNFTVQYYRFEITFLNINNKFKTMIIALWLIDGVVFEFVLSNSVTIMMRQRTL